MIHPMLFGARAPNDRRHRIPALPLVAMLSIAVLPVLRSPTAGAQETPARDRVATSAAAPASTAAPGTGADTIPAPAPAAGMRRFLEDALRNHPRLARAEAELRAAEARAKAAGRPLYNPEVEIEYDNALDNGARVGVVQTFDLAGKRRARAMAAEAELRAARARLALVRRDLATDLLAALAEHEVRRAALDLAENRERLADEFLSLARRRHRAGELPRADLLSARLTAASARAEAAAARAAYSRARERLRGLLGDMPADPPRFDDISPPAPGSSADVRIDELPEIRIARAGIEAARARMRIARRNRIPDPSLGLSVGRERGGFDPLGRRERTTATGVRLTVPLFVRNGFRAEVDAAGADLAASERALADTRRRVEARIDAAWRRYRDAFREWRDWSAEGSVPLEEQRTLLRRLFESGEIGAVEYTLQLDQTFAYRRAGLDLRARLWNSWFDWLAAANRIDLWMETLP